MPRVAKAAVMAARNDDELADTVGTLNSVRAAIQQLKVSTQTELPDGAGGSRWLYTAERKSHRSYNTSSLILKAMNAIGSPNFGQALRFLIEKGVITIKWNWTPLQQLIRDHNIEVTVVRHEIEDGDPNADIGEWWDDGKHTLKPVS